MDSESMNEIALLEFEKNSVEFRKKRVSLTVMRKYSKSDGLNNGVMRISIFYFTFYLFGECVRTQRTYPAYGPGCPR